MVGAVVENRPHTHHRIRGQGPLDHGFLQPLFHCRVIVLGHGAAHYLLIEDIGGL